MSTTTSLNQKQQFFDRRNNTNQSKKRQENKHINTTSKQNVNSTYETKLTKYKQSGQYNNLSVISSRKSDRNTTKESFSLIGDNQVNYDSNQNLDENINHFDYTLSKQAKIENDLTTD